MKNKAKTFSLVVLLSMLFSCGTKASESPSLPSIDTAGTTESVTPSESAKPTESISESTPSVYGLSFIVGTEKTNTVSKDIDLNSVTEDILRLQVTKDDSEVLDEAISYSISGDENCVESVSLTSEGHNYANVKLKATGNVTITFSLTNHREIPGVVVNYQITEAFLNKSIMRGDIKEENGVISIPSNVQATAVCAKAGTDWMLSATIKVPLYSSGESFGVGGFLDEGNHAFWSALRNRNTSKDGKYEIYLRDFYQGWDAPIKDGSACQEYQDLDFPVEDGKSVIKVKLIRNGQDYYFDINGYHHQYHAEETRPSYPGFFSQNQSAEITDYEVTYVESEVKAAIESEWKENAKLDILHFSSKDSSSLKAGESRRFSIVKAPEYAKENYTFTINDAFKDYVTMEDNTIKVSSYAPEGILEVTMKSESGKLTDTYTFAVTKEAPVTESDVVLASGGAYLSKADSIVFPDSLYENDGIGNEQKYDVAPTYGAILKNKIYGCSFQLDFDVENYNSHGKEDSKLLISLGGRFNQYYFSFDDEKGTADVKAFAQSLKQNSTNNGSYLNAEKITGLSGTSHHVRISTENGEIKFSIDEKEAVFSDGVPLMNLSSYFMELPVRIATANASCEVKNILAEKGTMVEKNIYGHNADYYSEQDGKYIITMQTSDGWNYRDRLNLNACSIKDFGACTGAYKATFKATLDGANSASKFCIRIGDEQAKEAQICFGENKIENGAFQNGASISIANNDTVYVTVYRTKEGKANIGVSKNGADEPTYMAKEFTDVADSGLWFWARNSKSETTKKITIENIKVENL